MLVGDMEGHIAVLREITDLIANVTLSKDIQEGEGIQQIQLEDGGVRQPGDGELDQGRRRRCTK